MTRNLKALGLCLVAVFAVSAISASAAMAEEETKQVASFTASEYPATITGTQEEEHEFVIGTAAKLKCKKSHFHAELTEKSTSLTVKPTYEECSFTFNGETFEATVTLHECYYTFTVHAGSSDNWTGQVHIICPNAGEKIEIHVYQPGDTTHTETARCTYTVEPQTVNTGISYENITAGPEAGTVTIKANEAPVTVKKSLGELSKCGAGTQNAKYTGKVVATATNKAKEMINSSIIGGM